MTMTDRQAKKETWIERVSEFEASGLSKCQGDGGLTTSDNLGNLSPR